MSDEIEEEQESSRDEKGRGPAMQSIDTPDSDELNLFVLDMYEQFTKDSGHAITEFEFTNHDEYTESSSEQTNMERFIAMIKSSEKVPQVYREMSNDEVRSLVQQGLQSQKFVPIVPNAGTYHADVDYGGGIAFDKSSMIQLPVKQVILQVEEQCQRFHIL